ncbi:MAG TPA: alanine/ornithine racemase family PLP-dependent enzyme [Thermoleophilia bacterium]
MRPTVTVDLSKLRDNTRRVVGALPGIEVVGVTKVSCGSPQVGRMLLAGGVRALGDSRLENAQRLRDAGLTAPIWLLRAPTPDLAGEAVQLADVSLESELETVVALDNAAAAAGRRHAIVAMVDLGDLREGMMPAALPAFLERVELMDHIDVAGIGVNLTCYGAIVPDEDNLGLLAGLATRSEKQLGRPLLVSGGNSGSIGMVTSGRMPAAVNTLRIGETILLGVDTLTRRPALDLHLDAITVAAPVIECLVKPSLPIGTCAQDAFGNCPTFLDRGERRRAICALGRQDAPPEGLRPVDPRIQVLGASSDHLILDVDDLERAPGIGDALTFVPNYAATLQLFTSPYVHKVFTPPA